MWIRVDWEGIGRELGEKLEGIEREVGGMGRKDVVGKMGKYGSTEVGTGGTCWMGRVARRKQGWRGTEEVEVRGWRELP